MTRWQAKDELDRQIDLAQRVLYRRSLRYSEWHAAVKKVLVVLTSPRSGSSMLVEILRQHPGIVTPEGEVEPYWILNRHGYPWTAESDEWDEHSVGLPLEGMRNMLGMDLLEKAREDRWLNRFALQYPEHALAYQPDARAHYVNTVRYLGLPIWHDGEPDEDVRTYERERCWRIEEPPFITPLDEPPVKNLSELEDRWLMFKNPADVYRGLGVYRALFPRAEIKVLHLQRHPGACMNGLLSGWESPNGFSSRMLRNGTWWSFCLPPGWQTAKEDWGSRVALQWGAAHERCFDYEDRGLIDAYASYEGLVEDPNAELAPLLNRLNLEPITFKDPGAIMATDRPDPERWRTQRPWLTDLHPRVRAVAERLGYA